MNYSQWSEIEAFLSQAGNQTKGELFEQITELFLRWSPKYSAILKEVWRMNDLPNKVLNNLGIPSQDQGIDLIAETHEGKYWAIQCKYHGDSTRKISHREISTFLALSNSVANGIDFCLVATTADDYAKLYKGQSNIGFLLSDTWETLGEDFFKEFGEKERSKPSVRKPRPHQKEAINEAKSYFKKEDRGKLIFPCGAGKSLTGYWICNELKAKTILVAVPSLALVKQTLEDYCQESYAEGNPIDPFCICSDEGIGRNQDVAVFTQDLGVPCTTEVDRIKSFLEKKSSRKKVVFTTYQSGRVLSEAVNEIGFAFDLGIMDESHKTVGAQGKLFSHLLFDENVSIKKRIFMTATERRYKGKSDSILSMDDEEVYGNTFTQLSFKKAIHQEILSDYKILTLVVSKDEIKKYLNQNDFVKTLGLEWEKDIDFRTLSSLVALRKAMKKFPIKHAVTFHSSIKRAKIFEQLQPVFEKAFPDFEGIESYHVTGAIPTAQRSKIIHEFAQSERSIITNAKCLTEGVDVPSIDCVLFADPRKSTIDIVQAVGRALRRNKNKEFGYVLLPVYTESTDKESIIESEDFQAILQTLRVLASNDERIIEYFRDKQNNLERESDTGLVQFDIDEISSELVNADDLIENIELKAWSRLAKLSWRPFEEALIWARNSYIMSAKGWKEEKVNNLLPYDIPGHPQIVYKDDGWVSWADFLGTDNYRDIEYLEFEEAREVVRKYKFKNTRDWKYWSKNHRPNEIPGTPDLIYKNKGWVSWADFLGADILEKGSKCNYEEAKNSIRKFNIRSSVEWRKFVKSEKMPKNIPANPDREYKNKGWRGWADFLGYKEKVDLLEYIEAKRLVGELGVSSLKEYLIKRETFRLFQLPRKPNVVYKYDWKGWEEFFGLKIDYYSFKDAKKKVHSLKLDSVNDWRLYIKSENFDVKIPKKPNEFYSGFLDWNDWIGIPRNWRRRWLEFESAREFVRSKNIANENQWREFIKTDEFPDDIPKSPSKVYQEWNGFGDWLGTGSIANHKKTFMSFESAKRLVGYYKIKNQRQLMEFIKSNNCPSDFPSNPNSTYKEQWKGLGDFLGTNTLAPKDKEFYTWEQSKKLLSDLDIQSMKEYQELRKDYPKLPSSPSKVYTEFIDWFHYLGKEKIEFYSYAELKELLQRKQIRTISEYKELRKIDTRIPSEPHRTYKDSWVSYGDLLDADIVANQNKKFMTFEESKNYIQQFSLKSLREFQDWRKLNKPDHFPSNPNLTYKNKGWKGWADFLGKEEKE